MELTELHKMIREALKEMETDGLRPSKLYIANRYKESLLRENNIHLTENCCLTYWSVPVEFANLADNIHFYINITV